jgi:chloramphenicol O-acetyltransferase type A
MFEWPSATPIDLDTYSRRVWYEHFYSFEIPITYRTVQIDVTELKAYCKHKGVKFSQTLSFILTRACNHVPEYRHRIEDEKPVSFDKIIPVFTVMTPNKVFTMVHGVFTDNYASDYERNLEIQDRIVKGLDSPQKTASQGVVFITVNPWTTQTAVQAPYTKRFNSVPVFCVGKMYQDGDRIKLGLGEQVHHGLVDGYHMGHFVHILERHLEDPTLIEGPFVSTFE